jgi:DNA-binding GntR family transcriptional regulator
MDLIEVDTRHAYKVICEKIVTLALQPGALINEQELAEEIETGVVPVREALKLLAHEELVLITPRHGLYVADINLPDLEQLSEMRLALEPVCARMAAQRADRDDLAVLEALRKEQSGTEPLDSKRLLDIDHKFHQALTRSARNKYLARSLEHLFGLSQRLWYLTLPKLDFLHGAVAEHLEILEAVREKDADRAERIMHEHVSAFYERVRSLLRGEA